MNAKGSSSKQTDKDLAEAATRFIKSYSEAVIGPADLAKLSTLSGYHLGEGGIVELTDEVTQALDAFVLRAAKLLGSAAAHEKAIADIAMREAQSSLANNLALDTAAKALISAVFEKGNATYDYLAPNKLVMLDADVKELKVGRVRAMRTSDFSLQRKTEYPDSPVEIAAGDRFSLQFTTSIMIKLHTVCWVVNVHSILDNVEEESKWLIDVAVSILRLSHRPWGVHYPKIGDKEPHPTRGLVWHKDGVKFQGAKVIAGGSEMPPWYEIDKGVLAMVNDEKFVAKADIIFAPPKNSLAARVSQGLGWLTRGRQAEDRAERFLYFFTAIEALLSNDDKTAPVTQTIARHGAVLLTNDNEERFKIATLFKSLYTSRSALVHAGNRSILWSSVNSAQGLAEALFWTVLEKADLRTGHATFCEGLAASSYGLPWPEASAGQSEANAG